ncbi:MAG: HDOD domain-containing protein [Desulfatiglandaceae bacterium]
MNNIEAIIKGIDNIKPIPQVTQKVMAVAKDPLSSASDLADIIQYDSALTANLLKMCNSPFFGLSRKVDSIHQAVAYLGINQVVDMALLDLGNENLKQAQDGYDLRAGELWKHAVVSAFMAKEIANAKDLKDKDLVFTASLLKDIGKTVLSEHVGNYFDHIEKIITEQDITFREGEKQVIGIDHAELGALIAEKWNFSDRMINIIRNHHLDGGWDEEDMEIAVVYVADTLCMIMGIGVGSDGLAYRFHPKVMEKLHFRDTDIQLLMASFGEKLHEVESLVGSV